MSPKNNISSVTVIVYMTIKTWYNYVRPESVGLWVWDDKEFQRKRAAAAKAKILRAL